MKKKNKIEIIAEIAQGYEGNSKLTELLTTGALRSGADAVKFQLVFADELATPDYIYYDLFKSLEMSTDIWKDASNRIHDNGQKLYFDVFGFDSLDIAHNLSADGVKLSTTEFYNRALIEQALSRFEKISISVGGIPADDIDLLVEQLLQEHSQKICLMYGFQSEPTPLEQNNLLKLQSFKERYRGFDLGFMDHSDGDSDDAFNLSLLAMGMGISVIEKHLTLDRSLKIEDYVSGLAPDQFQKFVKLIRKYEPALGSESLELSELENEYRNKAAKSVVALKDLKKGQVLRPTDAVLKRTGTTGGGVPIRLLSDALNRELKVNVKKDHPILENQV
ncbi:MAG: NeuB family protein [Candidatus Marinimicrobia bacterium]|jgi:sialic acid synthase SpsE|nr:NeuB family protein [Candidatus Neomarinimicrobiota bacterium]